MVFLDDKWHYDIDRHGNGEPCEGKCFNCRAPLKDDELFPAETKEPPVTAKRLEEPEGPKEVSMSMTRRELIEAAANLGIEVPTGAKKAEILELLEQEPKEPQLPGHSD